MGVVFCDEDFAPLYPSRRGRPSHPPSVLAALLLAQLFYGLSDRESERRSRLGLSWKAALGLPLDHRGIPHACLAEFRARLLRAGMVEFLNAQFLRVAKRAGVIGHRRAVDSTGIDDSVLTQDTVSLIRSAIRRCLDRLAAVSAERGEAARSRLRRDHYDAAGKPQICWASAPERAALWQSSSPTPRWSSPHARASTTPSWWRRPRCRPRWPARTSTTTAIHR